MKSIKNQKSIVRNFVDYSLNLQFIIVTLKKKGLLFHFVICCVYTQIFSTNDLKVIPENIDRNIFRYFKHDNHYLLLLLLK